MKNEFMQFVNIHFVKLSSLAPQRRHLLHQSLFLGRGGSAFFVNYRKQIPQPALTCVAHQLPGGGLRDDSI